MITFITQKTDWPNYFYFTTGLLLRLLNVTTTFSSLKKLNSTITFVTRKLNDSITLLYSGNLERLLHLLLRNLRKTIKLITQKPKGDDYTNYSESKGDDCT